MRSQFLMKVSSFCGLMRGQPEADVDRRQEPLLEGLVVEAERRLEGRDHVAHHIFRRIVQECGEPLLRGSSAGSRCSAISVHQHAMLGHGEGMVALGLAVPARHAGEAVRDVLDLDVERGGIRGGPAGGRTACAARRAAAQRCAACFTASWRWQSTR